MRWGTLNRRFGRFLLPVSGLLLLGLAGCQGREPARTAGSLDLTPMARWAGPADGRPSPPVRFPAAAGSPLLGSGWTVRPGAGGGPATAVSNQRHASLRLPLSPVTSGTSVIRLHLRDPNGSGGTNTGVIVLFNGRKVKRIPLGAVWADHRVDLPTDWFHQGVNELVLSGEPGRAAFQWLDLVLTGPQVHATFGDITRRGLVSPAPLVFDVAGPLPAGARLDVSLVVDPGPAVSPGGPGRYRLEACRQDGDWDVLLEEEVETAGNEPSTWRHGGWTDRTVRLDHLAGESVRLRLGGSGPVCVWGSPVLSWPGAGPLSTAVSDDGPNLILILADTFRADRLGAGGSAVRLTPALDAFSAQSVLFSDTVAQASSTVPSVSSFFTGRYFNRLSGWVDMHSLPQMVPLFAEALSRQGCRTLAVVSNPLLLPEAGFARGFDEYHHLPGTARPFYQRDSLVVYQPAEVVNARFLERLPDLARGRFFAYLHYMDPHDPYPVESDGAAPRFTGGRLKGRPWEGWLGPATREILDHGASSIVAGDRWMVPRAYDNGVRHLDRQLGLLLARLRRRGLLSNTVVAVVADHGEEFFEHGLLGHGHTVYDELLRVPALIRFPPRAGYPKPVVVGRRVELLDVAATLLEAMGAGPPKGHAGTSLLPMLLEGRVTIGDRDRHFETRDRPWVDPPLNGYLVGLESGGWKLIRDRRSGTVRLFHLDTDPGETRDLSATRANRATAMDRRLDDWLAAQPPLEPGAGEAARAGGEVTDREVEALKALGYMQ